MQKIKKNEANIARKMLFHFVLLFVVTGIVGIVGFLFVQSAKTTALKVVWVFLSLLIMLAVLVFAIIRTKKIVKKRIDEFIEKNTWYESILDAIPFPVHVTDDSMKWTYMNKAFENMLIKTGAIQNRESAYGLPCSNAGASICNTESCGIRQLREKNKSETYFDWGNMNCKQDTALIKDRFGRDTGYVEVVTDLTSILRVNNYSRNEIERLSRSLNMIASGKLDVDLEATPADEYTEETRGLFQKINDSLKKVKNSISILDEEAAKLAQAGLNGELDIRGDESKLNGVYARIIHGVNQTFDAIKEPLDKSSVFIDKLALGEPQDPLKNGYKGYYSKLIDNLNRVRDSLRILLSESKKLAQAGQNGELAVRGDMTKVSGSFADVINGMNDTFEAVGAPLKESEAILGKMAVNDFTSQMSTDYNGMFKDFAESINSVSGRLQVIERFILRLESQSSIL